jgi:hypothetical protein
MRQSVLSSGPAYSVVDQLAAVVTSVLDRLAPIRSAVRRNLKPSSRWLSPEAITAKRERHHRERRWLTTRDESDRVAYRHWCRTANSLINQPRNNHYRNHLAAHTNDPKKRWHAVGKLLHSNKWNSVSSTADNSELCQTFLNSLPSTYLILINLFILELLASLLNSVILHTLFQFLIICLQLL